MGALLLLALALTSVAAVLAVRSLTMRRLRTARVLRGIENYAPPAPTRVEPGRETALGRAFDSLATRIGRAFLKDESESELRRSLLAAGLYRTSPRRFVGYRVLAAVLAVALWVWLWSSGVDGLLGLVVGIVLVAFGWFLPKVELNRRRDARVARIDRSLPDLVDFLVVTVEAGIGFAAALHAAARRFPAPLGDELRLTVQEQAMGLSGEESLRNLLGRCETPMLRSFVLSIVQGETLGVSIGQILRNLAGEMRKRRRQAAEERAQKAPVKMLFPLLLLIFPALFVVLLGPAVYQILTTLGG